MTGMISQDEVIRIIEILQSHAKGETYRALQGIKASIQLMQAVNAATDPDAGLDAFYAAKAGASEFKATSFGAKQLKCATDGCEGQAIDHIIMGGIGSDYCMDCADKIIAKYKGERS